MNLKQTNIKKHKEYIEKDSLYEIKDLDDVFQSNKQFLAMLGTVIFFFIVLVVGSSHFFSAPITEKMLTSIISLLSTVILLAAAFNMFDVIGIQGKFWSPWRYVGYSVTLFSFSVFAANILSVTSYITGQHSFENSLRIISVLSFIAAPIVMIIGIRQFSLTMKKKVFLLSPPGILLSMLISLLFTIGLITYFPHRGDEKTIITIGFVLSLYFTSSFGLIKSVGYITGRLQAALKILAIAISYQSFISLQVLFILFMPEDFSFYYVDRFHVYGLLYVVSACLFVYTSMKIRHDIIKAREEAIQVVDLRGNPYSEIRKLILAKFIELVGEDAALNNSKMVKIIEDTHGKESDGMTKSSLILNSMLTDAENLLVINEFRDYLGEVGYDIAKTTTKKVFDKHPEMKFPTR